MIKGVIASSGIFTDIAERGVTVNRTISEEEIRYYTLYWDEVVIAANRMIYLRVPHEEELISAGILRRPIIQHASGFISGKAFLQEQLTTAKNLIGKDPGKDWVLHQIGDSFTLPPEDLVTKQTLRFNLINCLPVPTSLVPIADLLEFKHRRRDELLKLHESIEDVYLSVLRSPDQQLSSSRAITELQRTIQDLNTVSSERWQHTLKFDYGAAFNLNGGKLVSGASIGAVISSLTNPATIPFGAFFGALASMITLKAGFTGSITQASNESVLSYLANAHKEQIIS